MKTSIIPIFIPHLGCPNDCVFCNQKKISGTVSFSIDQVDSEIEKFLDYYKNKDNIELAFYGGSFTMVHRDLRNTLLSKAKDLKDKNLIQRIRISTRPDGINEKILEDLKYYRVDTVELGVQSLDDKVLELSKRGHEKNSVYRAVDLLKSYNFDIGLQQMLGLPGDTVDKSIATTHGIIGLEPDFVRIYPSLVIKDTEMANMYLSGIYKPLKLGQAIDLASRLYLLYKNANIQVIRMGLQSSDELKPSLDVLAGPHHDAFGDMVMTNILINLIIQRAGLDNLKTITASPRIISQIVGQKSAGKEFLQDRYSLGKIKFINDKTLEKEIIVGDSKIIYLDQITSLEEAKWVNVFKEY